MSLRNESSLPVSRDVQALDGGMHHSLALCSDGTIFAWGRADSGQLGLGKQGAANARLNSVSTHRYTRLRSQGAFGVWERVVRLVCLDKRG